MKLRRACERTAELLHLETLLARKPAELSGGQRQRVAIGRALVREAQVFLLDEPLSNLDAGLRAELRRELKLLHRRLGATMIHVTHDQVEAMTLATRIAIMRDGRILQQGAPEEVYARPASQFVAKFLGSPATNVLPGVVHAEGGHLAVDAAGCRLDLADYSLSGPRAGARPIGRAGCPPGTHPHRRPGTPRRASVARGADGERAGRLDRLARQPGVVPES